MFSRQIHRNCLRDRSLFGILLRILTLQRGDHCLLLAINVWTGKYEKKNREARDFYRTPRECVRLAADLMDRNLRWWEPCAGDGAISSFYDEIVFASDIYPMAQNIQSLDVLTCQKPESVDAIITNPPFDLAYEILDRALLEWKIPALFLIRIEPLSTKKRNAYTRCLSHMHIVSSLINFETEDGRIVHGNGTMRCAWCLFSPQPITHTITKWLVYKSQEPRVEQRSAEVVHERSRLCELVRH